MESFSRETDGPSEIDVQNSRGLQTSRSLGRLIVENDSEVSFN